jgi:hypothetical protein
MGYTHYFQQQREITDEEWTAITADAEKIIAYAKECNIPLAWEYDEYSKDPEVSSERIRFNGVAEGGHETFLLPRKMDEGYHGDKYRFNFCKTAYKAYDVAVCAVLMSMHEHAPGAWDIASDGGMEEGPWRDAKVFYLGALGKQPSRQHWAERDEG